MMNTIKENITGVERGAGPIWKDQEMSLKLKAKERG